jgi:hypothetical protein
MEINIIDKTISNSIEKYIIKKINKEAPYIYNFMSDNELNKIISKIKNRYNIDIDKNIVISIRSSYVKNHIIDNSYKLNKKILLDYPNKDILLLSAKYDIPPLNLIRYVFEHKYKQKLNKIMQNIDKISFYDNQQLNTALSYDKYTNTDNKASQEKANEFEHQIENKLKQYKIIYKTQEDLTKEQIKEVGHAYNTPDFLILSDLKINGKIIKWIDAKNFYGSNIKFDIKKINKQVKKYIDAYGPGCVIFSLGYNKSIQNKINDVLFVNYESIH